ncbi:MAG: hypothetical protein KBS84_05040 [Treponema sp.]|nr:hypothetical protein [Candidatus Treponema scatequi]
MKKFFVFLASLIILTNAFANVRGDQEFVPAGHWVYDDLTAIMLESGITHFYDNTPLTVQQIKIMLLEIDYENLSDAGKTAFDSIENYFSESNWGFGSDAFNIGVELTSAVEGQYKTNDDIEWNFGRRDRSALIEADIGLNLSKYVFMGCDIPVGISKSGRVKNDTYCNVPYNMNLVDINFPHKAYFSAGGLLGEKSGINFSISTLPRELGRTEMSSVILSDSLQDATHAKLKFFSPYFNYDGSIEMFGINRYAYWHNFEIRPHKKVSFSIFEGALPYGNFDLRYMNPFAIFHGIAGWRDYQNAYTDSYGCNGDVISYLGIRLNWTIYKYLRFYGNFAMNQFQMPNEEDKSIPNAMAFQLGFESFVPIDKGYLHLNLEGAYTNPYFMIGESPNWSWVKKSKETCDNADTLYEWIGFKYGPDTLALKLSAGYKVEKKYSVDFDYLFLARGELSRPDFSGWTGFSNEFDTATWHFPSTTSNDKYKKGASFISPSGIVDYTNVIAVKASYWPMDWMCITAMPSYTFSINNKNVEGKNENGFEFALSVKMFLTRINDNK